MVAQALNWFLATAVFRPRAKEPGLVNCVLVYCPTSHRIKSQGTSLLKFVARYFFFFMFDSNIVISAFGCCGSVFVCYEYSQLRIHSRCTPHWVGPRISHVMVWFFLVFNLVNSLFCCSVHILQG
jgi:hypothetical protein